MNDQVLELNEFELVSKVLTRKNSLKKHLKELDFKQFAKFKEDIDAIEQELKEEHEAAQIREEERHTKMEEIRLLIEKSGISSEEFVSFLPSSSSKAKKSNVRKDLYLFVDSEGNEHTWSGRGLTPLVFKSAMAENGWSKEDLLNPKYIEDESESETA